MNAIRTDTLNEISRGLDFLHEQALKLDGDGYAWKWIIIALDNVLQNAMIEAASDSSGTNILRKGEKVYAALRGGGTLPSERLDEFPALLDLCLSDQMLRFAGSRKLALTEQQRKSLKDLHRFRNEFIHFLPRFWILRLEGFREMASDVLDVVRFLLFESGNVTWTDAAQRGALVDSLDRLRKKITSVSGETP
ncbi:MAG: hypothetical protein M5U26_19765 [Planctomycetota bacterium]|nr:hypothetical protein [Planctomycetota bacterium]